PSTCFAIDSHAKSIRSKREIHPKYSCDCTTNTVNYLEEFGLNGSSYTADELSSLDSGDLSAILKPMQSYAELETTGNFSDETCNFVSRRWQIKNKILTWRHNPTMFFNKKMNLDIQYVQKNLEDANNITQKKTYFTLIEAKGENSDIQFSFVDSTNKTCNSTIGGKELTYNGGTTIGCAYLPGYTGKHGGLVELYGPNWGDDGLNIGEAAEQAFRILLDIGSKNIEKVYNFNKTSNHV
ncbi:uncharacterized protein LOC129579563, partial [Sitodiplosis mosellana]|uniref:uncharacterized protein LOC129579563 n=1 Tax=Sitodiplosis mosellana TaxID=263140 RepID=UPI002444C93E